MKNRFNMQLLGLCVAVLLSACLDSGGSPGAGTADAGSEVIGGDADSGGGAGGDGSDAEGGDEDGGISLPDRFFLAGAGKQIISPIAPDFACEELDDEGEPQCFNLGGYGTRELGACTPDNPFFVQCGTLLAHPGPATDNAQPTHARVLVLQSNQNNEQIALVTLDAVGAGNIILGNIRDAVNAETGIPTDNILIGETHSHSAADLQGLWGGVPQRWRNDMYAQVAAAVKQAQDDLQPVTLTVAAQTVDFNNYRREGGDDPTAPGAVYVTDKELTSLQAKSISDGTTVATLTQYSAHTTVLGTSNRLVHTDYVLGLHDRVEAALGGVSVFYNGVIADASPKAPSNDDQYARADGLGMALGDAVIGMLSAGEQLAAEPLLVRHQRVILPVVNPLFLGAGGIGWFDGYYNFTDPESGESGRVETLVSRIRIGGDSENKLELITVPGEATGPFGAMLRGLAGDGHQMLLGLTQNSLGYILPADEYGREGNNYEESVSLGPQTAPTLENAGYRLIFP